ncbi:MAG: hypothetical protein ABIF19_16765 [Planctomycetota bacterium]
MATEKCPFCGEEIDAGATRCFFCSAALDYDSVEKRLEQLQRQESVRRVRSPVALEVVVLTILVSVVLFQAIPGARRSHRIEVAPQETTVRLNANVTIAGTRCAVSNNDSFDWENVRLEIISATLDNSFRLRVPKIPAGQTYTANLAEFATESGVRFDPLTAKPRRFWIRCDTPDRQRGSYLAGWN